MMRLRPTPAPETIFHFTFSRARRELRKTQHALKIEDVTKDCAGFLTGIIYQESIAHRQLSNKRLYFIEFSKIIFLSILFFKTELTLPGAPGVTGLSAPRAVAEEVL